MFIILAEVYCQCYLIFFPVNRWTGSNTNPPNNEGQGRAGTDRSNVILLNAQVYPEGSGVQYGPGQMHGHYGTNYPSHMDNTTFLGLGLEDLENLAFLYSSKYEEMWTLVK